ncbi:hypothetical protein JW916_03385 [Candidatus Sumerlaeota bacterium]|nr:hypothetical protein [Candidatus Sumerlaeota bacterium]
MIVSDIRIEETEKTAKISAQISADTARKGEFRAWFELRGAPAPVGAWGDPFLSGFLIPCMWAGENLRIDAPVSRRLLAAVPAIRKTIRGWYPDFREIEVDAAETHDLLPVSNPAGCASLYSGGVDSWYSLLKHRDEITHLVLIQGFDIRSDEKDLWTQVSDSLADVAREIGKTPVTVRTNLKRCGDPRWASWGRAYDGRFWRLCYQGSALCAAGQCMQNTIARLFVPSSYPLERQIAFGSHPALDPLWSTENLDVVHDGCEAGRMEKVLSQVAVSPLALRHLRVCLENVPGRYNCCRCEKCLRTMIDLAIAGALDRAATFPHRLSMASVRGMYLPEDLVSVYREMMETARSRGKTDLADALSVALGDRFSMEQVWARAKRRMAQAALTWAPKKLRTRLKPRIGHLIK